MSRELEPDDLRAVRGRPEPEQTAAAVAALHAAVHEAASHGIAEDPTQPGWLSGRRPLRRELDRRAGWRGFSG